MTTPEEAEQARQAIRAQNAREAFVRKYPDGETVAYYATAFCDGWRECDEMGAARVREVLEKSRKLLAIAKRAATTWGPPNHGTRQCPTCGNCEDCAEDCEARLLLEAVTKFEKELR